MSALESGAWRRRLIRSLVIGALFALFAFVYFPLWSAAIAFVVGALVGLALPVAARPAFRKR